MAPFQAQAQQQNKPFTFRMDVEYPMVLGDKVRLAQIMDNLLSNALKYTLPGDSISVTLSQAGADNKNYLFVVADTGIGMSQEFLKRLYDPYARERRFGANSVAGSGLGLTIVKNLVSQKGATSPWRAPRGRAPVSGSPCPLSTPAPPRTIPLRLPPLPTTLSAENMCWWPRTICLTGTSSSSF